MKQSNTEKFEKMIEGHLQDKLDAAKQLQNLKNEGSLSEQQKLTIAEVIAKLTRTVKEMW